MVSLIAPYTLPSENATEVQLSQNFSQMYILMSKAQYSRNECCNNQLKTIFSPDNSFFQVYSHFPGFLNKIIKFQYFSRTGKTVVIFPGFPGAAGTLQIRNVSTTFGHGNKSCTGHRMLSSGHDIVIQLTLVN